MQDRADQWERPATAAARSRSVAAANMVALIAPSVPASLPASGVTLQAMQVAGWPAALADRLPAAIEAAGADAAPPLAVTLLGRHGRVTLPSIRLEG